MNYKKAGVDRGKADRLVDFIKPLAKQTMGKKKKLGSVGGYAALYPMGPSQVLAATTDGVGTKLKLAFETGIHSSVGIDLVAMSVNDLICVGARPLLFLDYFAVGKLDLQIAKKVISGIVAGCKEAECALVGGETAEMAGFYPNGEYDLAGFAVGTASRKNLLPRKVKPGMTVLGLRSSGFHSNGYSLVRKMITKSDGLNFKKKLLTPTRIYVKQVMPLIEKGLICGGAHITGSGFLNVPRISEEVSYEMCLERSYQTKEMKIVLGRTGLGLKELSQTFNMGIGFVMVVANQNVRKVIELLKKSGETAVFLGRTVSKKSSSSEVMIHYDGKSATLKY